MCLLKGTVQIGQYLTIVLRGQPSQTAHTKYCCKSAQRPATAQPFLIKLSLTVNPELSCYCGRV